MMIRSGLTLMDALTLMKNEFPHIKVRKEIALVLEDLQNGLSFSYALHKRSETFTDIGARIVETSEATGDLETGCIKIAEHIDFWTEMKKRILSAICYPVVVFLVALAVTAFLVFKVIPKFDEYMQKRGIVMPASTDFVISVSRFFQHYWMYYIPATIILLVAFFFTYRHPYGRLKIERIALKIPILGQLISYSALTIFSSTLALLLKSGLGLIESLKLTAETISVHIFQNSVYHAVDELMTGKLFKESLPKDLFPGVVVSVISVGEETGELGNALDELGNHFSKELKRIVNFMISAVEPVLIVGVGSIVAVVYFAIFQAILALMTR